VLDAIRAASGVEFEHEVAARRAGDPPRLCADVSRIENEFGWKAKNSLSEIVDSAWQANLAQKQ
jgi:UDP-glucose 4-epimerase